MHSRIAAAMRDGVERLAARPARSLPPRFRMVRLFKLLFLILAAVAVALYVSGAFDFSRGLHWRGMHAGPGEFALCSRANRTNCVVDGDTIHYDGVIIRI